MLASRCGGLFPLLFASNHIHHWSSICRIPCRSLELEKYFIHSPHRILGEVGSLTLVPNSTALPVRTSTSSVLMAFDVNTCSGKRWNARILSSNRHECDLFLMDSATLKPIVMAKFQVISNTPTPRTGALDFTLCVSFIIFDAAVFLQLLILSHLNKVVPIKHKILFQKKDVVQHRRYKRMVVNGLTEPKKQSTHYHSRGHRHISLWSDTGMHRYVYIF
jgi:hypothetical protein